MPRTRTSWTGKTDNTPAPPRVKLRVFDRQDGKCACCGVKLQPGRWQVDHILALINGGENAEPNLQAICTACHAAKTRQDVAEKAKTARVRKKHLGIDKPKTRSFRGWRKFNGERVWAEREK